MVMFMMHPRSTRVRRALLVVTVLTCGSVAPSSHGETLRLESFTIDGGGGRSTSGSLVLHGTIGQPDPGWATTETLLLSGGFWWPEARRAPRCPADLDGNQSVDFSDLLVILSSWGPCAACRADLDGSGQIDFADLVAVLAAWGACP